MNEAQLTVVGYVASTPTLIVTKAGRFVANMRVGVTPRRQDKDTGQWSDGDTSYVTVTCWRSLASNVAACLRKGDPIVVKGRMRVRQFDDKDGNQRTVVEVEASTLGHDLTRGVAHFLRTKRSPGEAPALQLARQMGAGDPGAAGDDRFEAGGHSANGWEGSRRMTNRGPTPRNRRQASQRAIRSRPTLRTMSSRRPICSMMPGSRHRRATSSPAARAMARPRIRVVPFLTRMVRTGSRLGGPPELFSGGPRRRSGQGRHVQMTPRIGAVSSNRFHSRHPAKASMAGEARHAARWVLAHHACSRTTRARAPGSRTTGTTVKPEAGSAARPTSFKVVRTSGWPRGTPGPAGRRLCPAHSFGRRRRTVSPAPACAGADRSAHRAAGLRSGPWAPSGPAGRAACGPARRTPGPLDTRPAAPARWTPGPLDTRRRPGHPACWTPGVPDTRRAGRPACRTPGRWTSGPPVRWLAGHPARRAACGPAIPGRPARRAPSGPTRCANCGPGPSGFARRWGVPRSGPSALPERPLPVVRFIVLVRTSALASLAVGPRAASDRKVSARLASDGRNAGATT